MSKKDKVVRTAQDLERKYNFASLLGLKKNVELTSQGIQKINNELNNILNSLVINLKDVLDNQSDVSLWFYSGTPTTSNLPYINWQTPSDHIGDIYYDQSTGKVYQYNEIWEVNTNPDLVESMAITNAELDVSDHERKVFFNTPQIPYSNGDWWIKNDGSLFICQISKTAGIYEENDFIASSNYTESVAEKLGEEIKVLKGTITTISDNYAKFTDLADPNSSTTIAGENISTGVIKSNNYIQDVTGMAIFLLTGIIDSKNFKTDTEGNVYLGTGAKVIGGDGLLTNLQYETGGDFQQLGFEYKYTTYDYAKKKLRISAYIPEGFTVTEAKLTLYHMPQLVHYNTEQSWCYARNIKLYKVDLTNIKWEGWVSSEWNVDESSKMTDTGAFGNNGYTPPVPTDSDFSTKEIVSEDIKNKLTPGMNNFILQSDYTLTERPSQIGSESYIAYKYSGRILAYLNIIGYMSFEKEEEEEE